MKIQANFTEQGTCYCVNGYTWCYRIKAHGRKDHKSRHGTSIFIAGNAKDVVLKISIKNKPGIFLSFPWCVCIVKKIRDKKSHLVTYCNWPIRPV